MTTQADATSQVPGEAAPPAQRGPRVTLQVLRVVAVLHLLAFFAQPVLAGRYLEGDVDAIAVHSDNAAVVAILGFIQLIGAIVFFWAGRGRAWPIWVSLAIAIAVEVQAFMGSTQQLAVHVPLGVALIAGQLLVTVWLFRAAAATPRPRRPGRGSGERG